MECMETSAGLHVLRTVRNLYAISLVTLAGVRHQDALLVLKGKAVPQVCISLIGFYKEISRRHPFDFIVLFVIYSMFVKLTLHIFEFALYYL